MLNPSQLAHLFQVLGFDIANAEDYMRLYKEQLTEIIPELKKIELIEINGKYYFENLKNYTTWPKVAGKNLMSFPNAIFLREKGIILESDKMQNTSQLTHLFQVLGFNVEIPKKK